jgi:hypothetical protein
MHGFNPSQKKRFALGRLKTGEMNKLEAKYSEYLEGLKSAGDILWFKFEGLKLRLADNTFYTPDFFVMLADETLECHECKGFMMEDANVKVKVAASMYPFRFVVVKANARKNGGGWNRREF